jgi:hypothetical protein
MADGTTSVPADGAAKVAGMAMGDGMVKVASTGTQAFTGAASMAAVSTEAMWLMVAAGSTVVAPMEEAAGNRDSILLVHWHGWQVNLPAVFFAPNPRTI